MTGGKDKVNERGPRLDMVLTAIAGLLAPVSLSCHHADEPTTRVQVNSSRPEGAAAGTGSTPTASAASPPIAGFVSSILDPRMGVLLRAADQWRQSAGPERTVIDQVYLVPDLASFLDLIATWDEHSFFPILIDDPAWTLPFLRAFRPARVVRIASEPRAGKEPARPGAASTRGRCSLDGRPTCGGPGLGSGFRAR